MGGIIQANIPDRDTLYASYMPYVVGGGLFVPTKQPVKMGEEVFVLDIPCGKCYNKAKGSDARWNTTEL